jgi:hypothetical protein
MPWKILNYVLIFSITAHPLKVRCRGDTQKSVTFAFALHNVISIHDRLLNRHIKAVV